MQSNIKLTICCLTYNHEEYISDALESFIAQSTNFNFNIIVFDDCSTDSTLEKIQKIKINTSIPIETIIPIENTYSKGNTSFYDLIKQAEGDYIALCEGDDYWITTNKIQQQVDFLDNNPDINICFNPSLTLRDGEIKDLKYGFNGVDTKKIEAKNVIECSGGFMPMASIMIRKNAFLKYFNESPDFFSQNLWHTTIQILGSLDKGCGYLPTYHTVYRSMHDGSWSLKNSRSAEHRMKNIKSFIYRNRKLRSISPKQLSLSFDRALLIKLSYYLLSRNTNIQYKYEVIKTIFTKAKK